ncbi:hypothetical protein DPX16_8495 [Anabarilius grahami]|uniref:Uncharacterized protein n=1 Tax=Anabarilius grahami TaxID=495550 RepID=A0A3N0Z3S9_ANAGA|nr:hypothetical protein DPX16_8495 [Anabarilius grahami]
MRIVSNGVQPYIVQTGVDTDGETQEEVTTFRMKLDVSEWFLQAWKASNTQAAVSSESQPNRSNPAPAQNYPQDPCSDGRGTCCTLREIETGKKVKKRERKNKRVQNRLGHTFQVLEHDVIRVTCCERIYRRPSERRFISFLER